VPTLGSGLIRVRGGFNCCSRGLPGAAWLFCRSDPASLPGLGPKARERPERPALAAGDGGQLVPPAPLPCPRAGWRHRVTVSSERGFAWGGWQGAPLGSMPPAPRCRARAHGGPNRGGSVRVGRCCPRAVPWSCQHPSARSQAWGLPKPPTAPGRDLCQRGCSPLLAPGVSFRVPRGDLLGSAVPASATSNYPRQLSAAAAPRPAAWGGGGGFSLPGRMAAGQGDLTPGSPTLLARGPSDAALARGAGDAGVSSIVINLFESCSRSRLK